ncbi:MAG: hypothetical protein ACLR7Z_14355 [Bilophila wadsworthia]
MPLYRVRKICFPSEAIHGNVAIDHNGVMRWVSSCFERIGISHDRVIGRTTYELEAEKCFRHPWRPSSSKHAGGHADRGHAFGAIQIVTGVPIYDDGDVSL